MPRKKESVFDSVESVLTDIRAGRMVIVTDDEDRENEGDLICAAEKITADMVNFMVRQGGGMLCVPVSLEIAERLNLPSMVPENREAFRTDFTVTVDAAKGISTGISAADRCRKQAGGLGAARPHQPARGQARWRPAPCRPHRGRRGSGPPRRSA